MSVESTRPHDHTTTTSSQRLLRRNFYWTLLGNLVYALCQWGMLIALARFGTTQIVGQFAFALALTAPVVMLTNLQLRAAQATDARSEYQFGHYLSLRLLGILFTLSATLVLAALNLPDKAIALLILLVGVSKSIESLSDVFYGLFQKHEEMNLITKSRLLRGIGGLTAFGIALYLTNNASWAVGAQAIMWLLVFMIWEVPRSRSIEAPRPIRPLWNKLALRSLVRLTLPLGLVVMLISLISSIPRYFIEHTCGAAELGIFASLAYLMVAGSQLVTALGESISPRLARYFSAGNYTQFRSLLVRNGAIALGIGTVGVVIAKVAGKEVLSTIYGSQYVAYNTQLEWIMVAAAASYVASVLGYGLMAARYFAVQIPLFTLVCIAVTVLSWGLIPGNGIVGATIALIVGFLIQAGLSGLLLMYALWQPSPRRST